MKKNLLSIIFCFATVISFCQNTPPSKNLNLGFEKIEKNYPADWSNFGNKVYKLSVDSLIKKSGNYSLAIEFTGTTADYMASSFTIPASYEGKKITLTGFIKTENVSDGWAGLWLRIDPQVAFDNMQSRGIKGTTDWKKYEITLDMNPEKTKQIVVGGLLVGKGKMWMDDLQISIDGKDIAGLKPMVRKEVPADKDNEFDKGSKIATIPLTDSKTEDLIVLGKVWGFLKYYHPAIAKGDYNWDAELFRIMPKIIDAKNQTERNTALSAWIESLGKVETGKEKKQENEKVTLLPDVAWIDNSTLGEKLTSQLMNIKNAKRKEDNYYIGQGEGVGNPLFTNERPYSEMKYPDAGVRLLSLYRYWNTIQYFFPYKNLIEENWNDVLKEFVPKFLNTPNELEYNKTVLSLIARVNDTHANIWGRNESINNYRGENFSPLEITFIENKAVVTDYYDAELGKKSGLIKGDVIETINNKTVEEIIKEKLPYTPASNYPTQLRDLSENLLRTNDSVLNIGYSHDGIHLSKQLECFNSSKINIYNKYQKKDTCFKFINPDIAYLYPGSVKNSYLPDITSKLAKTKGLIIDMRCYPSEFIVFSLSKFLQPEKTAFVKFSIGNITSPGLFTMTPELKVGEKNKDFYKGKVVIIVNEQTQSQAEYTTMAFRTAPKATVIGSTTAGADGNVSDFILPGGISTMISGIGVFYPDGKGTQRVGIVPDIEIKPTIKGIREGKDELLEKAIEIINGK